jgi:predicted DNA-binding transcriptional regulator YafY
MRGDQLARQRRTIRAIEANPTGLTVIEIAQREETGIRTIYPNLEALQASGVFQIVRRANLWAFIDTLKFKILPSFSLTELRSFAFTAFPTEGLKGILSYDSLYSMRALRK